MKAPGHLAIQFKSGVICLYSAPDLRTSDYISFTTAGSHGRWCWAHGLGPTAHPAYSIISPGEDQILHDQPVASS